ncbi:MAG: hypothetical protein Q8R30_01350 [bacterium]|nr:hypothetical protein [bacterium]
MENEEIKKDNKGSKARSKLYPRYNLEEAIGLIGIVSKLGRKNVSEKAVAAETGKSITNSGFLGRVSSAKQFGIISKEGGKLSLTQLGNEILFPLDEATKAEAVKKAFMMPTLYKELVDAFGGTKLPEYGSLGNRLINDYGIEAGAKDVAAKNFIKSAEYADVIKNGILVIESDTGQLYAGQESTNRFDTSKSGRGIKNEQWQADDMVFEFSGGMKLIIPRNKKTSEAIMDGELKDTRKLLSDFAKKYLVEEATIKSE